MMSLVESAAKIFDRFSFATRLNALRSCASTPIRCASESRVSPEPTDMSRASISLLPSMKRAVFQLDFTAPSCVQPDVPNVMPNVWLPNVPLVDTASTCGQTPAWPSNSLEPQPHEPMLFSPAAMALTGNTAATATTARIFFIRYLPDVTAMNPLFRRLICVPLWY